MRRFVTRDMSMILVYDFDTSLVRHDYAGGADKFDDLCKILHIRRRWKQFIFYPTTLDYCYD